MSAGLQIRLYAQGVFGMLVMAVTKENMQLLLRVRSDRERMLPTKDKTLLFRRKNIVEWAF
jgi:hypothetical protein